MGSRDNDSARETPGRSYIADIFTGSQFWRETFVGLGFPAVNDPFSGNIIGAVTYADAIHPVTKTRSFSGNAYLAPARTRPNLTLWTGLSVAKILFDKTPDGAVATGVQYTKDGKIQTVSARKEVILSAGTFHSPKILELSGIGDGKLLQALGIDVVVDNPFVGENLQNHPWFRDHRPHCTPGPLRRSVPPWRPTLKRRGPFSQSNSNVMAHIPFPGITTDTGRQDLEQILENFSHAATDLSDSKTTADYAKAHESLVRSVLTSRDLASGYYLHFPGWASYGSTGKLVPIPADGSEKYFTMGVILTHPLSRGSSHITNAQGGLAIDPKYLAHPLDAEVLARHVRFLESTLATAPPLAGRLRLNGKRAPSGWPRGFSADLDQERRFVHQTAVWAMHYTGTCSMMPREKSGVVDSRLRVYTELGTCALSAPASCRLSRVRVPWQRCIALPRRRPTLSRRICEAVQISSRCAYRVSTTTVGCIGRKVCRRNKHDVFKMAANWADLQGADKDMAAVIRLVKMPYEARRSHFWLLQLCDQHRDVLVCVVQHGLGTAANASALVLRALRESIRRDVIVMSPTN
ncbi:hypothetical protein VTI74DRAFT_10401 [Chaetomium olivicolor]